jgi:biopolymer transport protein ExbD
VLISIPGHQSFSVTDDATLLNRITESLAAIATQTPAPIVTIYAPKDTDVSRIRAAAKMVRAAGLTRINFALGQRNDRPGVLLK